MKILITGTNGQIGHYLKQILIGNNIIDCNRNICDLADLNQINYVVDLYHPDLIINCAAFTCVERAENESELAYKINRDAPKVLAEKALEYNIPFIHFSTDYIFDGKKNGQYHEDDSPNPLGVYGKSKLAGEEAIRKASGQYYIFRTSWLYSNVSNNFYLTIKNLCFNKQKVKIVTDKTSVPTSALFIAEQVKKIIPQLSHSNKGLYHLVPDGYCSCYEFSRAIMSNAKPKFNLDRLLPIKSEEYNSMVKRPDKTILANKKVKDTFMLEFNDWYTELLKYIKK